MLREAVVFARALFALQRAVRAAAPIPVVVHIHFASRGSTLRKLILAWMTLHAGRPLILHAHGGGFDSFYRRLPVPIRRMVSEVFQRADRFVVLSHRWKSFYVEECELSPSQIVVLPNPTRLPAEVPDRRERTHVQFLYLGTDLRVEGSIRPHPRIRSAWRERACACAAGACGQRRVCRRRAGSPPNAVCRSPCCRGSMRGAAMRCSRRATSSCCPRIVKVCPMAMLEAMASGLPLIVTAVGGIPDVVTDGVEGRLIAPADVPALALALSSMINDPARRWEFGQRARGARRALRRGRLRDQPPRSVPPAVPGDAMITMSDTISRPPISAPQGISSAT